MLTITTVIVILKMQEINIIIEHLRIIINVKKIYNN